MKIKLVDRDLLPYDYMCHHFSPDEPIWSREVEDPDVVVGGAGWGMDEIKKYPDHVKKAALIIEPSIINGEDYLKAVNEQEHFDFVFTHQYSLKDKLPENKFVFIPHGATSMRKKDMGVHDKKQLVNFIFSEKQWNSGHRYRHTVYEHIKDMVPCMGSGPTGEYVPFKGDILVDYAFSIAMENEVSDDYFTEKICDCFLTGTVPIYYGTKNIGKYFNAEGIITFETIEELKEIIPTLSMERYNELLPIVKENYEKAQQYPFLSKFVVDHLRASL